MKLLLVILATNLLLAAPANAQIPSTCFARVPALAAKLKVPPNASTEQGYGAALSVSGCDGKSYDLFRLLNALIDKMDKAAKK